MPKETVYESGLMPTSSEDDERSIVQVRWSREAGDVQIVTRKEGHEIAGPDEPLTYAYGMNVSLDRRGINDLIRKLRRARDQAFGRDE